MLENQQAARPELSAAAETAIASAAGAALGIASSTVLPKAYSLPVVLLAAIAVPKKNKGFTTALVLLLSWLIAFTLAVQ